jgi:NTP pyrophosphatase (non-canonical NTP hydrolase)
MTKQTTEEEAARVDDTQYDPPSAEPLATAAENEPALTFVAFSQANRDRCESPMGFNHRLDSWSSSDWMTAVVGELGEAANIIKKLNRYRDGVPGNKVPALELRAHLRKELGDVFVYLDLLCQSLGLSVADAAVEVFNAKSVEIGYGGVLRGDGRVHSPHVLRP